MLRLRIMMSISLLMFALSPGLIAQNRGTGGSDPCKDRNYDLTNPREFLTNLYCIAKQNRKDLWLDQMSKERQAGGSEYLSQHFAAWSRGIIEFVETNLRGDVNKIETETIKLEEGRSYVIRVKNPTAKPGGNEFEAFIRVIM